MCFLKEVDFEVPSWFLPLAEQATDLLLQHLVDDPLFSPLFPTYFLYLCASYGVLVLYCVCLCVMKG